MSTGSIARSSICASIRASGRQKMCALTEELFERNRHLLGPDDDYWVGQRISRGVKETPGDNLDYHGPNVVLECSPLPLVQRAKLFKDGIKRRDPLAPSRAAGFAHPARQDAQLSEPDRRQSGGSERSIPRPGRCCST